MVVGQIGVHIDGTKTESEHDPGNRDHTTVAASEAVQSPKLGHRLIVKQNGPDLGAQRMACQAGVCEILTFSGGLVIEGQATYVTDSAAAASGLPS